jgi:DNA replication protein DnaC
MNMLQRSTWKPLQPVLAREDCTICQGTGWETFVSDGRNVAKRCFCSALCRVQQLRDMLCIPPRYENCTLERYAPRTISQHHALKAVHRFASRYPGATCGLFLSGPPGVGKTHLATGALISLANRYVDGLLFVDFPSFLDQARQLGRAEGERWLMDHDAAATKLVLFDDFGCVEPSEDNLRVARLLLRRRLAPGKFNLFTGGPVFCRGAFGGSPRGRRSATHDFIAGLPGEVRLQLLTGNRILAVNGEDFRQDSSGRSELFY